MSASANEPGRPRAPFEGTLVRLRAREPEDESLLFAWFNDPEVTEHLGGQGYPVSRATERGFLARATVSYASTNFAVETLAGGRLIGGVDLRTSDPANRSATLGIAIGDKTYWDGGYGTDTMRTACRFGFEMMNLHRIQLTTSGENLRARHVYEKVGFREEGILRDHRFVRGRYVHTVAMGLLEGELR
ncbi:MAG: GNAT family protein [Tepidiformaceae bacterium]